MNLPNIKEARIRTKNKVEIKRDDYHITSTTKELGKNKYYCIYTYGCQMNVHDSENISAIMEEMGYSKKEEMEDNFYHLIEELDFIDSDILKDIRGEKI